jgi:replicative DNA helicase Mcm
VGTELQKCKTKLSSVEQVVTCTERACSNCTYFDSINHNPPLFSLPYHLSLGKPIKCPECGQSSFGPSKHHQKSAITIQMQDEKKQNALESLNIVLFDRDTFNIRNGEKAMACGDLHPVQQRGNSKRITYLFANKGIEYERPEDTNVIITEEDLSELNEFVNKPDMIEELTSMFAPTVIGHEDKKLAVILMYVGALETGDFRGRIHGLFIGPPGTAKSKLARAAKKLGEPQSRYSSTQGASGKSITAVIDKDSDSYVLRLGVLPQARNSMCILNEIASLSMEDQRHLFDVMEEGMLTLDKYGFHREIESLTTVLGTTNPEGGEWYMDIVEKVKIPLRKELVDRYDLVLVFEPLKDKESKANYAKKKLEILRKSQNGETTEDYTFLRKIVEHARTFNPQLSDEAEAMIIEYWSSLDTKIFSTNRVLETIIRVSIAFARLHFSNEVTVEIAKKSLAFITRIFKAFDNSVEIVEDPRDAASFAVAEFLMKTPNMPFKFSDCVNYAITSTKLVESYLGPSPVNTETHKYRDLRERFLQSTPVANGLISIDSYNPLTLVFKVQTKLAKEDDGGFSY